MAELGSAASFAALRLARCRASVAAVSIGLATVLAASGDRKEDVESKTKDWQFGCTGVKGAHEPGTRYGGIETCHWLCIELPRARLRGAVMMLALVTCCRSVMKKKIYSGVGCCKDCDSSCAIGLGENIERWRNKIYSNHQNKRVGIELRTLLDDTEFLLIIRER